MRAPEFWNHKHGTMAAPLTRTLLLPAAWLVTGVSRWRWRFTTPQHALVPVICLGNVTLGGTGKTPLALALAELLQKAGHKPAFLTRGYGGTKSGPLCVDTARHTARGVGDEALLLARQALTIVARDRVAGARLAAAQGASVVIMDDGFQNPHLAKDFSFLVFDAYGGLGNEKVFPAGPLRESMDDALQRADAIILMGDKPRDYSTNLPTLSAQLVNPESPPKGPVLAFAGIGRPQKFFDALRAKGAQMVQEIAFADHHPYSAVEISRLQNWAAQENATLVTTEKDFVRLPETLRNGILAWPVQARFADTDALMVMLAPVLERAGLL